MNDRHCKGCGILLQDENLLLPGYTTDLSNDICQRCFRIKNYGEYQIVTNNNVEYLKVLEAVGKTNDLVIYVTDLINMEKDFFVIICSNNSRRRLKPYMEDLGVDGVAWSMKPLMHGLIVIKTRYKLKKKEMVLIGDQIVTDIFAGNKFRIKTILVDPLGIKDMKITYLNRKIEDFIVKIYTKRGKFERGRYYE